MIIIHLPVDRNELSLECPIASFLTEVALISINGLIARGQRDNLEPYVAGLTFYILWKNVLITRFRKAI